MSDFSFLLLVFSISMAIIGAFAAADWFETKCKEQNEKDYQEQRKRHRDELRKQIEGSPEQSPPQGRKEPSDRSIIDHDWRNHVL